MRAMLGARMAKRDKHERSNDELDSAATQDRSTFDSQGATPTEWSRGFALTILHHPDGRRVGESTAIGALVEGVPAEISRATPGFQPGPNAPARPLGHRRLSRSPLWVRLARDRVSITPARSDLKVAVEGQAIASGCAVDLAAVRERGLVLALGGCVLLYLHESRRDRLSLAADELLGVSPAIGALAHAIARVAPLAGPVFVRGERGAGRESVAREMHRLGERAAGPWISVDLQATPAALAARELFDIEAGCLARAHGGTLFLNDVDRLSTELQAQLLLTVERNEVHAEDGRTRPVDVRVITASADDLQKLVDAGKMRSALAHRLQNRVVDLPSLRARRADIPILLHHFLRASLAKFDALSVLDGADEPSSTRDWLRVELLTRLMRYSFPGNIAELRTIAEHMATFDHDGRHARLPAFIKERMRAPVEAEAQALATDVGTDERTDGRTGVELAPSPPVPIGKAPRRAALSAEIIRATLRKNRWNISRTARALGVSRNTLIARVEALPDVRLARDLAREDIVRARGVHGDDLEKLADALQVSSHGLRLRCRELGLD